MNLQENHAQAEHQTNHAAQGIVFFVVLGETGASAVRDALGNDLDRAGLYRLQNHVGGNGSVMSSQTWLGPFGVVAADRDLHDLGVVHGSRPSRGFFSSL